MILEWSFKRTVIGKDARVFYLWPQGAPGAEGFPGMPGVPGEDGAPGPKVRSSYKICSHLFHNIHLKKIISNLLTVLTWKQGEVGLPGPRGLDGADGKGAPGEKVRNSCIMSRPTSCPVCLMDTVKTLRIMLLIKDYLAFCVICVFLAGRQRGPWAQRAAGGGRTCWTNGVKGVYRKKWGLWILLKMTW